MKTKVDFFETQCNISVYSWVNVWYAESFYVKSYCYQQDLPKAALPVLFLLTADFWGWHVALIKLKFGTEEPNFTLIGPVVGLYGPKTEKKWNFINIIAHKGRVPCMIFFKQNLQVLCASSVYINVPNLAALFRYMRKLLTIYFNWGVFNQIFDAP